MATLQQVIAYLTQYKAKYPLPTLKAQLLKQQVPPAMLEQAIAQVMGGAPPAAKPPGQQPAQPQRPAPQPAQPA
ncbi:MAG: hypothetical protein ABIJ96_01235, partial [Elusimicrobiota bacterium]